MRILTINISRLVLSAAAFSWAAMDCYAQSADELVQKNMEARGGLTALAQVRNVRIEQEITQGATVSHSTYYAEDRNKFRFEQLQNGAPTFVQVMNGGLGWLQAGKGKPMKMSEKDAFYGSEADGNPLGALYIYKERGYAVELIGKDTLRGADVFKLRVKMKAMEQVIYLDAKTYLEVKIDRGVMNYGKESSYIMVLEDYRPVSGVLFAHLVRSFPKGQPPYTMKRKAIAVNVESNGLFDEPVAK